MPNEQKSYYEGRIMAMSTLLCHITRQVTFPFPGPPESIESQAFYHIATLMTRGSADEAHARDVIAVTGVQQQGGASSTSGLDNPAQAIPPSSPDINDCLVEIHITITQNQSTQTSSKDHTVSRVYASKTPVNAILHAARQNTPVSLEQHAADVFKSLKLTGKLHKVANDPQYFEASYLALSVIIARSFPKIMRRVGAAQYLFKSKFLERMLEAKLDLSGKLEVAPPRQVRAHQEGGCQYIEVGAKLEQVFMSNGVPLMTVGGVCYFLFHNSSVMKWMKTLAAVYNSIRISTRTRPTRPPAWRALYTQLEQLHRLVYLLGSYYDAILSLQGVIKFLQENLQETYSPNDLDGTPSLSDADADHSESDTADTLSDIGSDGREPASQILLRYFRAIVAWNQAYTWLDASKVFRSPRGEISLNIVKIQVPKVAATPVRVLLDEFLETYAGDRTMKERIGMLDRNNDDFAGVVHAEAVLMALIKESSKVETTLSQELVCILKDANKIGVANKCCWMCNQLREAMMMQGTTFGLPGTSGIIFAWAPPMGLDLQVLEHLESQLKIALWQYLNKYAYHALQKAESHQSSPATDFMDTSFSDFQLTEERLSEVEGDEEGTL